MSEEMEGGEKGGGKKCEEVEEENGGGEGGRKVRCQRERGSELFLYVIDIEIKYCWNYTVYLLQK